jgi:signal transduction histidine kinase
MAIPRFQFGGSRDDRGLYAALGLLLLAVLIPTACLLYLINEAVATQRNLAQRQLGDAYRGQLRLMAERIDSFWNQRAVELGKLTDAESPSIFFEHCVRDGLADSVICLQRDGRPAYPSLAAAPRSDPTLRDAKWAEARLLEDTGKKDAAAQKYESIAAAEKDPSTAARAWQAAIRCLVASGRTEDALRRIEELAQDWRVTYATGLDGRSILADEYRLAMQLLPAGDSRATAAAQRLFGVAQNYSRAMPSAQRLFLMDWLRGAAPAPKYRTFPTYQAERLAERVLSSGHAIPGDTRLQLTGIGDVWKLTPRGGRVIALYSTDTILKSTPRDGAFALTPPGRPLPAHGEVDTAASLPGWQLSLAAAVPGLWDGGVRGRTASYLWIGFLTIAAMGVLAVAAGQLVRREMRIAHLKTDLVAAVSHELKTPLASMKLLVESLLSGAQFEPQRTREYLQMVARENSRLSRLIDNFLTFSRMERNRGKFQLARCRPEEVVRAAMESIGDRYAVELDVEANLPALYADEDALVTVLLNLLDNAYKYSGDDRRIVLRVRRVEGRVCFAVEDNGIGIAEKDQKRIFRRFFQVDRSLARQAGGVGLGLSIVEYIVKAHGGEISVVSRPGAGSTFSIFLAPSSSAAEAAA